MYLAQHAEQHDYVGNCQLGHHPQVVLSLQAVIDNVLLAKLGAKADYRD